MDKIFGPITSPTNVNYNLGDLTKMSVLLNNILKLLIVIGGLYALVNIVLAGYQFIGAVNDPKKIEAAWAKIWQSVIGLLIIVASFALGALLSKILFGNATVIFNPKIIGPGT
jgi:hypothetical protein